MSVFLGFSCTIFHLFCVFPSFFIVASFFSCGRFISPKLSSSSLLFLPPLVSSFLKLSLFLRFYLFMVDFSLVRSDCPSISFFFTCLCSLLEFVDWKCSKVGLFEGRDCAYRFVLLFLFPLVHHSIGDAQTLTMSGEEVRSSELETSLFSSEDSRALEVTSSSTLHRAWVLCYALKEKDERRILSKFQFPPSVLVRRLVILMPTRYAFMRLTSSVVFDFPSIHSSKSFSSF